MTTKIIAASVLAFIYGTHRLMTYSESPISPQAVLIIKDARRMARTGRISAKPAKNSSTYRVKVIFFRGR